MMNKELENIAVPLKKYLKEHLDPHCSIVVDMDTVRVVRVEEQRLLKEGNNDEF